MITFAQIYLQKPNYIRNFAQQITTIITTMDAITICTIIGVTLSILSTLGSIIFFGYKAGRYAEKFNRIEGDCSDLKKTTDELIRRMTRVEDLLIVKSKTASSFFAAKNSPRVLNQIGQKVFNDMEGQEFLTKNKEKLYAAIDASNPRTAYDVELNVINAIVSLLDSDALNDIKVFVYNYPTIKNDKGEEVEVTLADAIDILSLPLRDMYLNDHKEILR